MCFGHCSPHLWSHPRSYVFTHVQTSLFRDHWSSSFLEKRVKPLKRFSVSFFPMKIISKADLGVWLGILTAAEICCCPFDMSSENFSRQCTHLHCPVKKNAFRSFSSHIRGTLWVSLRVYMRVGGTEGTHWTSYKIKILSTWSPECFGSLWDSESNFW